jgi:ubiquinone/menaquinone biosynthesis C-methylase UbiE
MKIIVNHINEPEVAEAFSRQAPVFDKEYASNPVIKYKRSRVRQHVMNIISPHSNILELNSGTGDDAIFFARQGHSVHATDISEGMQLELKKKVVASGLEDLITTEKCSFMNLDQLKARGPYDLIFSNFGGLNCTSQLDKVLASFPALLKPGGQVCMVIIPPFCLWESMLFFNGEFKLATRRFFTSNGAKARVEGKEFRCWYYSAGYVKKNMKKHFELTGLEGLCSLVPPSYKDSFPIKHPSLFERLQKLENKCKASWPWHSVGDYFIISFKSKVKSQK